MTRPSWSDYLLGLARVVSARSHDIHTQHGCVLAGKNNEILATGCNGFPRGMKDDSSLPTTRPEKYPWMIHAERNAISSTRASKIDLEDATAYVTGPPCFQCLIHLWQHGIKRVVHIDGYGWKHDEKEAELKEEFLRQSGMVVEAVQPNLQWLINVATGVPISTCLSPQMSEEIVRQAVSIFNTHGVGNHQVALPVLPPDETKGCLPQHQKRRLLPDGGVEIELRNGSLMTLYEFDQTPGGAIVPKGSCSRFQCGSAYIYDPVDEHHHYCNKRFIHHTCECNCSHKFVKGKQGS